VHESHAGMLGVGDPKLIVKLAKCLDVPMTVGVGQWGRVT
jgi:hypothetical protein